MADCLQTTHVTAGPCDSRGRMGVGRGRVWPVDRCGPNHAWHTDTGGFVTSASQKHSPGVALSGVLPFHVFRPCELGPGPVRLVLRALPVRASHSARLTALRMAAISPACSWGGWPSQATAQAWAIGDAPAGSWGGWPGQVIAAKRVEALRFCRKKRIVFRRRPVVRAGVWQGWAKAGLTWIWCGASQF